MIHYFTRISIIRLSGPLINLLVNNWSVCQLSTFVRLCLSVDACLCLYIYVPVCVCMCVCLSVCHLSVVSRSVGRSVCVFPFSRSTYLNLSSMCLFACLCLSASVCLMIRLSVCLSVCLLSVGRSSVFLSCRSVTVCTKRAGSGGGGC